MTKFYLVISILISAFSGGQQQDVDFTEVNITCLDLNSFEKEIIITTNNEYKDILKRKSPFPNCNSDSQPQIDFSESILVGYLIESSGCSPPKHSIRLYKSDNKVVFEVSTAPDGACRMLYQKMVWITTSKVFSKQISFVRKYTQN